MVGMGRSTCSIPYGKSAPPRQRRWFEEVPQEGRIDLVVIAMSFSAMSYELWALGKIIWSQAHPKAHSPRLTADVQAQNGRAGCLTLKLEHSPFGYFVVRLQFAWS